MDKVEKTLSELKNANLYHVLEIEKTDDHIAIKKAYKKQIKKYHPDKNKEVNTVEKFDRIKIAYDLLKNEELKALYDSKLKSKEERKIKKKQMNDKRRKFADDLENRERTNSEKKQSEFFNDKNKNNSEAFKEKNKYKQYEEEFNKMFVDDDLFNSQVPKRKSLEEKLSQYGIKIKWKSDMGVIFTKEILKTYFKEFGQIEEIILKESENKALILFNNHKAIRDILNSSNHIIHKLFRIKKYSKKEILSEKQKEFDMRSKYLDSETLDMIRNKQFMSNMNYLQEEKNKMTSKNEKAINKQQETNSFEKFNNTEKTKLHDDKKENSNADNNLNFDLDLSSMENLLFERINKMK
jgi:curved DNA-binding protein CbpA